VNREPVKGAVEFSPDFRVSAESPAAAAIGSMTYRRQPELTDRICKGSAGWLADALLSILAATSARRVERDRAGGASIP